MKIELQISWHITFIWQKLGQSEIIWGALKTVLEHGAADDLPGVLPVGQHDALVHDHTWKENSYLFWLITDFEHNHNFF